MYHFDIVNRYHKFENGT